MRIIEFQAFGPPSTVFLDTLVDGWIRSAGVRTWTSTQIGCWSYRWQLHLQCQTQSQYVPMVSLSCLVFFHLSQKIKKKKFLHYISRSDRWHFLIWKSLYPLHFGRAGLLRIIILIVKCFLCFNIIVSFDLQYFLLKKNSFWDLFWLLCYKISHFPLAALKFFPMLTLNFWKYCDQCSSDIINL